MRQVSLYLDPIQIKYQSSDEQAVLMKFILFIVIKKLG